jgi:hypothetical protein
MPPKYPASAPKSVPTAEDADHRKPTRNEILAPARTRAISRPSSSRPKDASRGRRQPERKVLTCRIEWRQSRTQQRGERSRMTRSRRLSASLTHIGFSDRETRKVRRRGSPLYVTAIRRMHPWTAG